jgi:hypothetical protein
LIPKGCDILVYGALDMGEDYARRIRDTNYCRIVAYADKNWRDIRPFYQYDIISPDLVSTLDFDYALIASTNHHEEIRQYLISIGINGDIIKYAEIREHRRVLSPVVNLYHEYFLAKEQGREMDKKYTTHPIHKLLVDSLVRYDKATLSEKARAAQQLLADFSACDNLAILHDYEDERYMYGNAHVLMSYCGYENGDILQLPGIHHGPVSIKWDPDGPYYAPIVIGGKYQRSFLKAPVIEVGPYIFYAKPLLLADEKSELKSRIGRTLTIFLAHSILFMEVCFDKRRFEMFLREEAKKYDSVFLCLNFNDISDEQIRYYERLGARIVTAGVRKDPLFLNRLRSILDVSDMVLCDHIGSPLNFATAMKKQVQWFDSGCAYSREISPNSYIAAYEENKNKLLAEIKSGEVLSESALARCNDLFSQDQLKTPEELRAIFEMNELIYKRSYGDCALFEENTYRYLDELAGSREREDALKYKLLNDAWNKRAVR